MKTKNLKDYLNKNKKKVKVIEDNRARESICKTIEGIVFSDEILSSDIMSSDLLSEGDHNVKKLKSSIENKCTEDKCIKDKEIKSTKAIHEPIEVKPPLEPNPILKSNSIPLLNSNLADSVEIDPTNPLNPINPLDSRINKIKQFTNLNLNLDLNKLDTYLILPKPLLRLLKIFKSLLTIQNYNLIRKLTSIFIKVKGSIERTLRTRIEEEDIKKIYYLLGDKIEIKSLKIEDKGEMVKTFTFKIKCTGEEMEKRMIKWLIEEKEKEVPCKEWEEGGGGDKGDVKSKEVEDKGGKEKEGVVDKEVDGNREDKDEDKEGDVKEVDGNNPLSLDNPLSINNPLASPTTPPFTTTLLKPDLTPPLSISPNNPTPPYNPTPFPSTTRALNKTNSILERIKEKELKRKQDFIKKIQKKNEERDLIKRILVLFKKEGKQALKIKDVIKILEIFEGERQIKGIVKENPEEFEIREISEEKYLIYKKVI